MSVFIGEVPTFEKLPDNPREQAKKILEEASEVFAEVELTSREVPYSNRIWVVEECVDVILATANLLAYYGEDDLTEAIKRKIEFNERRGYVYEGGKEDGSWIPKPGDMVVYSRHPEAESVEIGVVKRVDENGAFVAYHAGDTCSKTPFEYLKPVQNEIVAKALVQRMEQLGKEVWGLSEGCEDWSCD